jgi:hypothetical protein
MFSSPLPSLLSSDIISLSLDLFTPEMPKIMTNSVQDRKRYQEAPPEEVIAQLQIARDNLVLKKTEMERKIAGFHEKKRINSSKNKSRSSSQDEQETTSPHEQIMSAVFGQAPLKEELCSRNAP